MARTRTEWAEDRTILANERTFSSWIGTGMGGIGVAIGLKAVFGDFEPTWAAKAVATLFLVAAILVFWAARRQALKPMSAKTKEMQRRSRLDRSLRWPVS